ncbi:hypothetical protein SAMN05877753_103373 [Bacillus oleivorans]|uniref:Uncharacterized protein n=1 Tax=Bacillus oleivorans TaxID=1448271 RepID=A0A285CQY6_9BACI|nr:DUF5342 family protein [Bacillus oleivorans]SNX69990.1 hypothetical protein SAMN05877753_103373 [Bacillus oleivorans]
MISHFQCKPIHSSKLLGWSISFFYNGRLIVGTYRRDGQIEWDQNPPSPEELEIVSKAIHELMLFHVYDGS